MPRLLRILLIVLFLAGQFALAAHEADLAAHADGEHCPVCLHAKPLGHGAVVAPVALSLELVQPDFRPPQFFISLQWPTPAQARAPPRLS